MKNFSLLVTFLLLISTSVAAHAVDPTIVPVKSLLYTTPTERADNTLLPVSEIAGFNLYWGVKEGVYDNSVPYLGIATLPTTEIPVDTTQFPDGEVFIVVTTIDVDGRESIYSNSQNLQVLRVGKPLPGALRWK